MDPTTRGNLLIFFGSMLVLAAFWLIVLGAKDASAVRIALGICAAVVAATLFRIYVRTRR